MFHQLAKTKLGLLAKWFVEVKCVAHIGSHLEEGGVRACGLATSKRIVDNLGLASMGVKWLAIHQTLG
jgi:hypothetical protein